MIFQRGNFLESFEVVNATFNWRILGENAKMFFIDFSLGVVVLITRSLAAVIKIFTASKLKSIPFAFDFLVLAAYRLEFF